MTQEASEERVYQKSRAYLFNVINDIVEMQKGKVFYSDTQNGKVGFETSMYGMKNQYLFMIRDAPDGRALRIEADGDAAVFRMFALLESILAEPQHGN